MYELRMCDCGRGSYYARGLCLRCYQAWHKSASVTPINHGTRWGYTRGCRCDQCRNAESTYKRQRKSQNP